MAAPIAFRLQGQAAGSIGALTSNDANPQNRPGRVLMLEDGSTYQYVRTEDALILGDAVTSDATFTDTAADAAVLINLAAGYAADYTGTIAFDTAGANVPTVAVDSLRGWYATVNVDGVPREGDTYRIVTNTRTSDTAGTMTFDRGLDTALVDNDTISVWCPWRIKRTTATTQELQGIALATVTAANYCWIQKTGVNFHARALTTAAALTVNAVALNIMTKMSPSATAGALVNITATTTAATTAQLDVIAKSHASLLVPFVGGTAATRYMPVYLSCPVVGS